MPEDDVKAALLGGAAGGLANLREEMPFELQALEIVLDVVRTEPGAEVYLASRVANPNRILESKEGLCGLQSCCTDAKISSGI